MYLQFWTFIERWQNFFFQNKINYYVYIQSLFEAYNLLLNTVRVNRDCLVGKGGDTRCHALRLIEHQIQKSQFLE